MLVCKRLIYCCYILKLFSSNIQYIDRYNHQTMVQHITNTHEMTPIPQYPHLLISNEGHVYSTIKNRYLKPRSDKAGYLFLNIRNRRYTIHKLVITVIRGPPSDPSHTVDHIDRNVQNNHISNLRWSTRSEQCLNRRSILVAKTASSKKVTINSNCIEKCNIQGEFVEMYQSVYEAARENGISSSTIRYRLKTGTPGNGDFMWKYSLKIHKVSDLLNERWRNVDLGNKNYYISNQGRVKRSIKNGSEVLVHDGIQNCLTSINGYFVLNIYIDQKTQRTKFLHQWVMEYHGQSSPSFTSNTWVIDHIDENKTNNNIDNLQWLTLSQNSQKSWNCRKAN